MEAERDYGETPMTSSEKNKNSSPGYCWWDSLVESFKLRNKSKQDEPADSEATGAPPAADNNAQLEQLRQEHEETLQNLKQDHENQLERMAQEHNEEVTEYKERVEELEADLQKSNTEIETFRRELEAARDRVVKMQNTGDLIHQYEFVVADFSKLQTDKAKFTTPPFYSQPGGYKMILEISLAGQKTGAGTHISVSAFSLLGEYDSKLTFPAKLNLTIQLINQTDKNDAPYSKQMVCVYSASGQSKFLGAVQQFVSFAELQEKKDTHMKDDQLWFRITEIKVDTMST